jgi:hypothetical protein
LKKVSEIGTSPSRGDFDRLHYTFPVSNCQALRISN